MENSRKDSIRNSNLVEILGTFTESEFREFGKFVHSPFYNNRSDVERFFETIKIYYPSFQDPEFTKEIIFMKMYPQQEYKDDIIRRLSSNLFKLAEEYAAITISRADEFEKNKNLLDYYVTRSAGNLYNKHLKRTEKYFLSQPQRDANYFLHLNFADEYKRIFLISTDPLGKKTSEILQKQIEHVWKYAMITLCRLYRIAVTQAKQYNKEFDFSLLEPLLKIVEDSGFKDSAAVEIWYLLIKFHTTSSNDDTFYSLKKLIEKNIKAFNDIESFIIYVSLMGYCFEMNNYPDKDFQKEDFEIVKLMLSSGLLVQGDTIYSEWFMYAFISSLRAGDISFAEKFLEKYGPKISGEQKENVLRHANAELALERSEFDKVLGLLVLPKFNNVGEKLRSNQLYLKIYFELGMSEQFFYTADSFKHLIRDESSLSKDIKKIRENFIKYTVMLFRYKLGEIKTPLGEIRREVMKNKILGNKWLLRKLDELERK